MKQSAKDILQLLPTYRGEMEILATNQSVRDIQKGIDLFHNKYAKDYDKIYKYFLGRDQWQTAQNIFTFLKNNTSYYIEGLEGQTVRNPSAILATGKLDGIDCKNYALFIGGILDAINRSGKQNIPFAYRYAQTDFFGDDFNHVFIVVNPGTNREFFIDPIPEVKNLDDRFPIYSYQDKKIKAMLYGLSGTRKQVGFTIPGVGVDTDDVQKIFSIASNLFKGNQPNRNDWIGWDQWDSANGQWLGSSVRGWVLNDGDDVNNEALNILSYIKTKGLDNLVNSGKKTTVQGQGWRDVTLEEIAKKFERGGLTQEAQQLRTAASGKPSTFNPTGATLPQAGLDTPNLLLYAGVALVAAKLLKIF